MENRTEHLLEAYFAHSLNATEAEELKTLLQTDPKLAAEFRFQQQIARSVKDQSLRSGIENQEWAKATIPPVGQDAGTAIKRSMWSRYLYAAAAVITLLVLAWVYIPGGKGGDLIAEQTAPYPNKMTFKSFGGDSQTVPQEVIQAFSLYDQAKYPEAAQALGSLVASYPDNVDYRFYWGVSLIHAQQYPTAIKALEPISQGQNDFKTVSYYYLGLAYAGNKEMDQAKTLLQRYLDATDGVSFRKQAKKVLDEL
jgi:tetratricopeptide (TPR) repeat protein